MPRHEIFAEAEDPRLDLLIAQRLDISRNQAATLIANGAVLVRHEMPVKPGATT